MERVIASQKGDGIAQGSHILKRTVCFAHFTNITVISIVLLVHYGPDAIRREINKYEVDRGVHLMEEYLDIHEYSNKTPSHRIHYPRLQLLEHDRLFV